MTRICLYFQAHQPLRLRRFGFFDIGSGSAYFDGERNRFYLARAVKKCYEPANALLLRLHRETGGSFCASFSITGVLLEQLAEHHPDVLSSFGALADAGFEFFAETYYHSLAFLFSKKEFAGQVALHRRALRRHLGAQPAVLRNTEALYCNRVALAAAEMGFKGVVAEGLDWALTGRSPNYVYKPPEGGVKLLLRNYRLSDDIAFRFSTPDWPEHPLTADKYAAWLAAAGGDCINLFMDYETFGEHQWPETGIFAFLEHLPRHVLAYPDLSFCTASQALEALEPVDVFDVPRMSSWADVHRDTSAWLENEMQRHAFNALKALRREVLASEDKALLEAWRRLQTSDHFYYMCTKWFADGDVHKYFNPYETPYDAFINYMNVLTDLKKRVYAAKARRARA